MEYGSGQGNQGICPVGWHLPSDYEWCILANEADAADIHCDSTGGRGIDAGGNLKETGEMHWNSPNTGATNLYGFTGLPGGYRTLGGTFSHIGNYARFWSSEEVDLEARHRGLSYDDALIYRLSDDKNYGFSARCIIDNLPPEQPSDPYPETGSLDQH